MDHCLAVNITEMMKMMEGTIVAELKEVAQVQIEFRPCKSYPSICRSFTTITLSIRIFFGCSRKLTTSVLTLPTLTSP